MLSKPDINSFFNLISSFIFAIAIIIILIIALLTGSLLPSQMAHTYVYGSLWFYLLQLILFISIFSCCIKHYYNSKNKISFILIHSAILVILSGGFITTIFGDNGFIELSEGEIANQAIRDDKSIMPIPFKIKLNNFKIERYKEDIYQYILLLDRNFNEIAVKEFSKATTISFAGIQEPLIIKQIVPDFAIDTNGQIVNRSKNWNNPAIEFISGKSKGWLLARYMRHSFIKIGNHILVYKFEKSGGEIKSFRSNVTVTDDNNSSLIRDIEVNKPLKYQGYVLYQFSYNDARPGWTAFQIKRDPGVPVVITGYIILIAGILCHLILMSRIMETNSNV